MRKTIPFFSVGLLSLASLSLGGCVTSCTGDPRTDSLGCASSNLSSGRYDRDTARLAARAANDMDRADATRRTSASLSRDRADLQAEAGRLRAALSSADQAVAEARSALVRARADGRGSGSELAQLSERLESVQSKRSRAQNSGLENEVAALDQDVARLRQMVVTLSGR